MSIQRKHHAHDTYRSDIDRAIGSFEPNIGKIRLTVSSMLITFVK